MTSPYRIESLIETLKQARVQACSIMNFYGFDGDLDNDEYLKAREAYDQILVALESLK